MAVQLQFKASGQSLRKNSGILLPFVSPTQDHLLPHIIDDVNGSLDIIIHTILVLSIFLIREINVLPVLAKNDTGEEYFILHLYTTLILHPFTLLLTLTHFILQINVKNSLKVNVLLAEK